MGQRSVPAPFLTKTYQLVDDRSTDDVVSWNEIGTTFVVWKTADFARDLLPNYFKHNNFSSFVRQLNTYGFRKIVPDKWEFANDNFKRGEKDLLTQIRRRRRTIVASNNVAGKSGGLSSPSNSSDDLGSTSTSSPDDKNVEFVEAPARAQFAELTDENQKLKKDNELLSSELAQTKQHCDDLIGFLTGYVKVAPEQIKRIMRQGRRGPTRDGEIRATVNFNDDCDDDDDDDDDDEDEEEESSQEENGEGLKLFGVWVKKRGRDKNLGFGGAAHRKEMKTVDFDAPWMKICSSPRGASKVCN